MPGGSSGLAASPIGRRVGNPVTAIAIIMYATFALLMVAIPQGMVNWVKDFNPGPAQDVVLAGAEAFATISGRLGADIPYRTARDFFLRTTGKNED
jgi:hypothetical protein